MRLVPAYLVSLVVLSACASADSVSSWEGASPGECENEADDDGDGLYDCNDPDCAGASACDDADTDTDTDADTDTDTDGDADADTGGHGWDDLDDDGWARLGGDCDDDDATVHPLADEVVCNGKDDDCDGILASDADGDGHGCVLDGGDDCDDAEPGVHPGASDTGCDGVDQDCDGTDSVDGDGDGLTCDDGEDCDDADARVTDLCVALAPAGTFEMGCSTTHLGCQGAWITSTVTLTRDFYVGLTEVTRGQFEAYTGYASRTSSTTCVEKDCPALVTWDEAAAFTNAMSSAVGLTPCYTCTGSGHLVTCEVQVDPYACEGWRLPTEAEWEYATRASTITDFSTGGDLGINDSGGCRKDVVLTDGTQLRDIAWYCGYVDDFQPVTQLLPNPRGMYDAHGNASEWVSDLLVWSLVADGAIDPVDTTYHTLGYRSSRGGSSFTTMASPERTTSWYRCAVMKDDPQGLRVALTR